MKKYNVYFNGKNMIYLGYENENCKIKNLVNTSYAIFKWIKNSVEYSIKVNLKYARPQHINGDIHFKVKYLPEQQISVGVLTEGSEVEYKKTTIDKMIEFLNLHCDVEDVEPKNETENDVQNSPVWI